MNTTLNRLPGVLYALDGRVDVGNDLGPSGASGIVLTLEAGVIVFGKSGTSWLAVNRGNRISAVGTATRPIVFTSRDNVLGLSNDDSQGQWGGVVLMGRAPITDCAAPGGHAGHRGLRTPDGRLGGSGLFGGASPTDNSGTMDYVQIRYSGYVLGANSELQSLTLGRRGQRHDHPPHPDPQQLGRRLRDLRRPGRHALSGSHRRRRRQHRRRYGLPGHHPVRASPCRRPPALPTR